ncbi:MAG: thioredoxin family protein, partial [Clostridia bacterium]|nr:thioredoxin family protein [Clostridia bacterium]
RGTHYALRYAAKRFDGRIWVGVVDYDYCAEVFHWHDITEIPTLIMFENGVPVKRFEGFKSSNDVDDFVLDYLGLTDDDVPEVSI